MGWMFLIHHLLASRSSIWKRVGKAFENTLKYVTVLPLQDSYQVLNTCLWWHPKIQGIGFGFSKNRVAHLDISGLYLIQNMGGFKNNQPHATTKISHKLQLSQREYKAIKTMIDSISC
jgi:hypothetical protein